MAVVREDVVKLGFDVEMSELLKASSVVDDLKKNVTGGIGGDAFDEMIRNGKRANDALDDVKKTAQGIKPDGIDDTAKGLKETDKEAGKAHEKLKKIANTGFSKTVSGLKSITTTLGKVGIEAGKLLAKGIAAGAAGVGLVVGQSIKNFADYEQLVGGVDTLFKDASGIVQDYASNAFKTTGLSANEYMENVTSFSASLIQSCAGDTMKAAGYAHMAMVDMADNANKMGTNISAVQDAYQGFAKQNFTMLDNLKLGYGGTQSEMQRLLKDAQKIQKANGKNVKYSIKNFGDIVEAIHVIQESMGIAGTTSEEASETILGSFSALKASWSNMLTGLVLGGDEFDRCIENLVDSALTFGRNIMPALTKSLEGVGRLITELAPVVEKELPGIIDSLLPPLIRAAAALISGIIKALPSIVGVLIDELPGVLSQVWQSIKETFGDLPGMEGVEIFFGKLKTVFVDNADLIKKVVGVALGLIVAFKLFNKIKGLTSLFGGGSGAGGAGGGMFARLAKMNPGVVLKGILNITIILGGLAILASALMYVAPYMAQLSDLKSIGEVVLVIAAVGVLGSAMANLAGKVGMIPVSTVAKGLADIAIALVGFGALAAVLMWLSPYMAQLSDLKTTFSILLVIGAVGLVGSALGLLSGLVGAIPISAVLMGIANIAIAIAGFALIVAAFGLLSKIDGFNDFMTSGGETLANLCRILGEMAGSIVGGFAEGVTDSLATIGTNLSSFATAIQPMFETFAGVDSEGLSSFAAAFAAFIAAIAGEKIVSVITGGIDYADLGTKLSSMATSLSSFFTTIMTFPEGGYDRATALFDCLAGISSLPKEGGVVGWFAGEVDYSKMATGLTQLSGAVSFFTAIQDIPETAFTNATKLFDCLAGIKSLPNEGGVVGWFAGEVNFTNIATGLVSLTSASMVTALTTLSTIPETAFTGLTALFDALAGIKSMPKEGGIAGWFSGDSTTGLTNVASQLPGVATDIASFFTNLGDRTDFSPIKSLFDTLGDIEIDSDAAKRGLLGLGSSDMETMGKGLSSFATEAKTFFDTINTLNLDNLTGFFSQLSTMGDLPTTLSQLDTTVGTALDLMITTVQTKMTSIKTEMNTGILNALKAISTKSTAMYNIGVSLMQGLNNGMISMLPTLVATAASIASSIKSATDTALDINSPSRVMEESGVDTVMGQVVGMRKTIPLVEEAAFDVGGASIPYANHYTPDTDSGTVYNNGGNSEVTTISPTFNLTVNGGTTSDRELAYKIKQFVSEAIMESFESLDRKNPVLREA